MIEIPRRIPLIAAFVGTLVLLHGGTARAWPSAISSSFEERGKAVATDRNGNTYVAGTFDGVLSASNRTVTSNGERDLFVAKLNPLGTVVWMASAGGDRDDEVGGIGVDNGGNVYVTGTFSKTMFFTADEDVTDPVDLSLEAPPTEFVRAVPPQQCPDTGITIFVAAPDAFVAKLNKDGKWLWGAQARGRGFDQGNDLVVQANGVYLTGSHGDELSFIDSDGVASGVNLLAPQGRPTEGSDWDGPFCGGTSAGCATGEESFDAACQRRSDMFVARIGFDGRWTWALQGANQVDWRAGDAIAVDAGRNIYVVGRRSTVDSVFELSFLAKFKDEGARGQLMAVNSLAFRAADVATDGLQNVLIAGTAAELFSFGNTHVFPSPVGTTPLIARFADTGDAFTEEWASHVRLWRPDCEFCHIGGDAAGNSVAFDDDGNGYLSGYFSPATLWVNSGFETPGVVPTFANTTIGQTIDGWNVDAGGVLHMGTSIRAPSGKRSILLGPGGSISLGLNTGAGDRHLIRFALAAMPSSPSLQTLQVKWGSDATPPDACRVVGSSRRVHFGTICRGGTNGGAPCEENADCAGGGSCESSIRFNNAGTSLVNPGWEEIECEVTANAASTELAFESLMSPSSAVTGPLVDDIRIFTREAEEVDGHLWPGGVAGFVKFSSGQTYPDPLDGIFLEPFSVQSQADIFVASVDSNGTWRWASRAGGTGPESAVAIAAAAGGELVTVGDFADDASFENRPPNESGGLGAAGGGDAFAARITDEGQWVAFQKWVVGQEVPPPAGACGPGNADCPMPKRPLPDLGGGTVSSEAFFLWSEFDMKLYAIGPATATIKWFEREGQLVPSKSTTGTADFPGVDGRAGSVQTHVATAPVDLELNAAVQRCGPGGNHPFHACRDEQNNLTPECGTSPCERLDDAHRYTLMVRDGNKPSFTNNGARIIVDSQKKVFDSSTEGHSVLVYVNAPNPDASQGTVRIDVVRTIVPVPERASCAIGSPLVDPEHRDPNRRNGWVLNPASRYDGVGADRAHDRARRAGPIIPVNEDAPADESDDMLIAWYRQNDRGIAWPEVVKRYDCTWPEDAHKIVIASGIGSDQGVCRGAVQNGGESCSDKADCIPLTPPPPVGSVCRPGTGTLFEFCTDSDWHCETDDDCAQPTCAPQAALDPTRFPQARIYDQPNREDAAGTKLPGFNPNEEHALLAPSSNDGAPFPAVFALRNDLGDPKDSPINELSEPYVLLKYREPQGNEWRMKVYEVMAEEGPFTFDYDVEAGEQIQPPYPLTLLPPCAESCAPDGVDCGGEKALCEDSTRKHCVGGDRAGVRCDVAAECPGMGGACMPEDGKRCSTGPRHGEMCAEHSDCRVRPTCAPSGGTSPKRCNGGSLDGAMCTKNADCQSECRSLCEATSDNLPLFKDYRGVGAGGTWTGWWSRAKGTLKTQYFYPLQNGFYSKGLDLDHDGAQDDAPGTCVPWLDRYAKTAQGVDGDAPVTVTYDSAWPASPPQLDVGETLLHPSICSGDSCLPNIRNQLAAEIIFEQRNDVAVTQNDRGDLVRLFDPLAERAVFLRQIADDLTTDRDGARTVITGNLDGDKIPFALRTRLSFEPGPFSICDGGVTDALACVRTDVDGCAGDAARSIAKGECKVGGRLRFRGVFDERNLGEPLLLPNVLTDAEWEFLRGLSGAPAFKTAVDNLYRKTRNPNGVKRAGAPDTCHHSEISGACPLEVGFVPDPASGARPENVLETKALSAGDPRSEGFLTVIFNNERTLSPAPVTAKVIRVGCGPYQGQVQVIQSDNVFDEQLTLRHNGDFGGDPSRLEFDWYYALKGKDCPGIPSLPYASREAPGSSVPPSFPWLPLARGNGVVEVTLQGAALTTLADSCVFTRYTGYAMCGNTAAPSQWAGAPLGSQAQVTNPKSQLAPGWLARVVRALNPFDSRTKDFRQSPVNTFASMITQAGKRYEGDIAFNGNAENLNRIGLIEAYETVLRRGLDLSVNNGLNVAAVNNKLLDVSTRLSGIFMLLGNEAFSDAQDPTVGFDTSGEYGTLAPAIFAFQDQTDSLLSEELALLRGREDGSGPTPIYNRLIWNFTGGTGQVAYQQNYNIRDQDQDGFINEFDARALFPQGHGDAWGHYLTAVKAHYRLLRHPNFRWLPRSDSVLVAGSEVLVDFTDERKFADAAAARARAGAQIVDLTYRQRWVDDPNGQWQGYKDTDPNRAFGVAEWAARAGQGAYFDWVVANGILPPASDKPPGIEKIDRTTVPELHEIVSQFTDVQAKLDQVDAGLNPVGLAKNVVPFDIDPTFLDTASTSQGLSHFEQIYERATSAFRNAVRVFDNANSLTALLRKNQDSVDDFRQNVVEQERHYNNRLIEILGSPYPEDIGPGKTYPSGYTGPDLWNFDIVEQSELTGGAPGEIEGALVCSDTTEDFAGFPCTTDTDCPEGECKPGGDFTEFSLTSVVPVLLKCDGADRDDPTNSCRLDAASGRFEYDASGDPKTVEGEVSIRLSNAGFGRVKDPSWTRRLSPGEMQMARSDLVQSLGQFRRAVADHQRAVNLIECDLSSIRGQNKQAADVIELLEKKRNAKVAFGNALTAAKAAELTFRRAAETIDQVRDTTIEGLPKILGPLAADPSATMRFATSGVSDAAIIGLSIAGDLAEGAQTPIEQAQNAVDDLTDVKISGLEQQNELFGLLGAIGQHVKEEAVARAEALTALEAVRQAQARVDSTLAQGLRHYDELIAFRKKTAAQVADTRYNDMAFRIFRNDALQKYKAQFDLTTRYTYLAAAAYDYETNLLGTENNAGRRFLTDIVRHRSLGQVIDNQPIVGSRGLADSMARMRANFDVLKGQLGFNNPQTETNRFSLRRELFRVLAPESFCDEGDDACEQDHGELLTSSNEKWREMLERHRVANLWGVRDFRRFARPFAPESAGPQPAIVIPFDTNVTSGLNFFGWPLAGGDSSYDPTSFSTKVRSVGVWFGDYSGRNLSNTPRVYLIPVGADVLRPVSAFNFTPRQFLIMDQKIPVPFPIGSTDLTDPAWSPMLDSLGGSSVEIRRYDALRAYHDSGFTQDQLTFSSRAVGRSVWNTRWVLIIPGATLLSDAEEGLNRIIYGRPMANGPVTDPNGVARDGAGISDLQMFFQTYAYSGN